MGLRCFGGIDGFDSLSSGLIVVLKGLVDH